MEILSWGEDLKSISIGDTVCCRIPIIDMFSGNEDWDNAFEGYVPDVSLEELTYLAQGSVSVKIHGSVSGVMRLMDRSVIGVLVKNKFLKKAMWINEMYIRSWSEEDENDEEMGECDE